MAAGAGSGPGACVCDTPRVHATTRLEWRQRLVMVADKGVRLWGQRLFDGCLYSWLPLLMAASSRLYS